MRFHGYFYLLRLFLLLRILLLKTVYRQIQENDKIEHIDINIFEQKNLRWLFLGSTSMWICNSIYLFSLPLFISKVLVADVRWSGVFLGVASLIEFPIMVCAGFLIVRTGKRLMMLLGAGAGIAFFVSLI